MSPPSGPLPPPTLGAGPETAEPVWNADLDTLAKAAPGWAALAPTELRQAVEAARLATAGLAARWVELGQEHKRASGPAGAEEWALGPLALLRYLRLLGRTLDRLAAGGRLLGPVGETAGGQVTVGVLPGDGYDRLLLPRFRADVWMTPGVGLAEVRAGQARAYREAAGPGVSLVLGAGNGAAIAPTDALERLVVRKRAVLLKLSPVNDYLGPLLAECLAPFVVAGVLRFAYGGPGLGARLVADPRVTDVHVTGSDRTYAAIVSTRRAASVDGDGAGTEPAVTAELGNVTPVVVVPGRWSASDLAYQAANVASMIVNNAGFNCVAARVVVTAAGWDQRERFLDALRRVLAASTPRFPYYPGGTDRYEQYRAAHPGGERLGVASGDRLPWLLIPGLDPAAEDDPCFTTEAFAPVCAETALPGATAAEFLGHAVDFANDRLWGTLGASLVVHPRTAREPGTRAALASAVAKLRYGTVAVNHWSALAYTLGSPPWGAYAGGDDGDGRFGRGFVHNSLMLDHVEKTVLRGPFRVRPRPMWFPGHPAAARLGERFTTLEAAPSARAALALLLAAGPSPRGPRTSRAGRSPAGPPEPDRPRRHPRRTFP